MTFVLQICFFLLWWYVPSLAKSLVQWFWMKSIKCKVATNRRKYAIHMWSMKSTSFQMKWVKTVYLLFCTTECCQCPNYWQFDIQRYPTVMGWILKYPSGCVLNVKCKLQHQRVIPLRSFNRVSLLFKITRYQKHAVLINGLILVCWIDYLLWHLVLLLGFLVYAAQNGRGKTSPSHFVHLLLYSVVHWLSRQCSISGQAD